MGSRDPYSGPPINSSPPDFPIFLCSKREKKRRNLYDQLVANTDFFSLFFDLEHGKISKSGGDGIDRGAGIRVPTSYMLTVLPCLGARGTAGPRSLAYTEIQHLQTTLPTGKKNIRIKCPVNTRARNGLRLYSATTTRLWQIV